ncbi:MAG: hypothetical protein Q7K45_01045 [Nanoarchaeota archaeon]|nr:hypothetical protein [Nanoarchaeota archaeon]
MDNIIVMKENTEIESLSKEFGFTRTLFLDKDFILLETTSKKEILDTISRAKGKPIFYRATDEETLRFVLERTPIKVVFGAEFIAAKDSLHHVRGGLDQVLCKIATEKGKIIAFSFHDLVQASNKGALLARMKFNIKLCQKYKVTMFFSTFAKSKWELRSAKDLEALWRVMGGSGKNSLKLNF